MTKMFTMEQFTTAHVTAVANLDEFRATRAAMLASTPISQNPTLFERTQVLEDRLVEATVVHRGKIKNQRQSVEFDNLVLDEREDRRNCRRRVRSAKEAFLDGAIFG